MIGSVGRLACAPARARRPRRHQLLVIAHAATPAAPRKEDALLQKLTSAAGFSVRPSPAVLPILHPDTKHVPGGSLAARVWAGRSVVVSGRRLWVAAQAECVAFWALLGCLLLASCRPMNGYLLLAAQVGDVLSQGITGNDFNPLRSLELGMFGYLLDGPMRNLLGHFRAGGGAAAMAGKVSSKVSSVLDGKACWAPLLACLTVAALKAAEGDPAALVHSCEVRSLLRA